MTASGQKTKFLTCERNWVYFTLTAVAGFWGAYTYLLRGNGFCNAQTGNVVLMSQNFMVGRWMDGLRYLFPLLAFAFGVFFAERIQGRFKYAKRLHWRQ